MCVDGFVKVSIGPVEYPPRSESSLELGFPRFLRNPSLVATSRSLYPLAWNLRLDGRSR